VNLRTKYTTQRRGARARGVTFLLTFDEWLSVWEPYPDRSGLVMCRTGDKGPYQIGNVRIDTRANNTKEAFQDKYQLKKDGVIHEFTLQADFVREHNLRSSHVSAVLSGYSKQHKGWRLPHTRVNPSTGSN